jgi:Fic family protein
MGKAPMPAPRFPDLFDRIQKDGRLVEVLTLPVGDDAADPKYRHWDILRHLSPPKGLSSEEWWFRIKFARNPLLRPLPLVDPSGQPFTYAMPDGVLRLLHFIDQRAAGEVAMPEVVTESEGAKRRYLVNSLIEEAIRSSQLEGAATSRKVAEEMLRSGRAPTNRGEQMILNNYRALEYMREQVDVPLTPDTVFTLHRILTEGTLDNPDAAGRLQRPDEDRVVVYDRVTSQLVHTPPPAEQLPERLEALCRFANDEDESPGFLHPVVRSVLLHFWMGYDHPFEDGNGRTARALFYWSMSHQKYWLTEYLSISRILRQAPSKYMEAYLYTETDERDTTYFILYQLEVIKRAIEDLYRYLRRKTQETREAEALIRQSQLFNHRQLALLSGALRNGTRAYTIESHRKSHRVSYQTARSDLLDLKGKGLLDQRRTGHKFLFTPAEDLAQRLGQ